MKACTRCQIVKSLEAFPPNPRRSDGRQSWCRDCHTEHRRAKRAEGAYDQSSQRAYGRALLRLRDLHRDEFDRLYRRERRKQAAPTKEPARDR